MKIGLYFLIECIIYINPLTIALLPVPHRMPLPHPTFKVCRAILGSQTPARM